MGERNDGCAVDHLRSGRRLTLVAGPRCAALHFTDPIVIILLSVVLSVPLLLWLAALPGVAQGDSHAR